MPGVTIRCSRRRPGKGGEHGAVSPVRPWAANLPPQHRNLVPQDQDLRVLGGVTPARSTSQPNIRATERQTRRMSTSAERKQQIKTASTVLAQHRLWPLPPRLAAYLAGAGGQIADMAS